MDQNKNSTTVNTEGISTNVLKVKKGAIRRFIKKLNSYIKFYFFELWTSKKFRISIWLQNDYPRTHRQIACT